MALVTRYDDGSEEHDYGLVRLRYCGLVRL
jgi:hypothetical protein